MPVVQFLTSRENRVTSRENRVALWRVGPQLPVIFLTAYGYRGGCYGMDTEEAESSGGLLELPPHHFKLRVLRTQASRGDWVYLA